MPPQSYNKEIIVTTRFLSDPGSDIQAACADTRPTNPPTSSFNTTASLSALAAATLAACGGGGGDGGGAAGAIPPGGGNDGSNNGTGQTYQFTSAKDSAQAASFLQQAQFSSTQAEIAQLRSGSYADWLNEQYDEARKPRSQSGADWLAQRGYDAVGFDTNYYNTAYPADYMLYKQLMDAPDAMRQRVALALSEFFVVSLQGGSYTWQSFGTAHWWDLLCRNAFGNYRQLLEDVTLNAAMGTYLNVKGNKGENGAGRVPDENYAREVMQLFTIGLYQLNLNGTEKKDANNQKIDSYTQSDVSNLARVFTGYNYDVSDGVTHLVTRNDGTTFTVRSRDFTGKRMSFSQADHSTQDARFLGVSVPGSTSGVQSLRIALDTLANHPNVAPFFSKQMIQRLVTSNPTTGYVERVAKVFNNNSQGIRGDLRAVWSAILLDDEARNPQNASSTSHGKLREPMLRFIQWGRSFGFKSAAGSWKLPETSSTATRLGQSPLRSPSVFNFFRPGFVPPNTALAASKTPAPEFQIVNETTVAGYLNFMQGAIRSGFSVRRPDLAQSVNDPAQPLVNDMAATYTQELALVADAAALTDHLNNVLCAGRLSAGNVGVITAALNATPITATSTDAQKLDRISAGVLMVMASSDYLVQK
jgi:uncharacterized protein (DUF1800 family)